jgi:four helix bundle protein
MTVKNYTELIAWQRAMALAETAYRLTAGFPRREIYGLSRQMRNAAVSVPSNIAEGQGRRSTKEFLQHLSIAHGSLRELETQILLSGKLGYLAPHEVDGWMASAAEVGRLINGLANSLTPNCR